MAEEFDEAAFINAMENAKPNDNSNDVITDNAPINKGSDAVITDPPKGNEPEGDDVKIAAKTDNDPTIKEVIKEVEKIVYKDPEFKNEETKKLYELWLNGDKDAVKNYIKETEKDYKTMSDVDIQREALKREHPNWSKADVELEIRHKYGSNLEKIDLSQIDPDLDADKYEKALAHNNSVEKNLELLAVHARDSRYGLIDAQSKIELPEIKKQEPVASNQPSAEEIKEATEKWHKNVEENIHKLSDIKQTIDDKEVVYSLNDEDKKALVDKVKNFNIFNLAKERQWVDENGVSNAVRIAEDLLKLYDFEKITKSFTTQIKTVATKDVIKNIKNVDDVKRPPQAQSVNSLEDAFYAAGNY